LPVAGGQPATGNWQPGLQSRHSPDAYRHLPRTRQLTIIAGDPTLRHPAGPKKGRVVTAKITIPAEKLDPGPRGYRVHCIDYDASSDTYYDTAISESEDLFEASMRTRSSSTIRISTARTSTR
jgi:hypothetical protein